MTGLHKAHLILVSLWGGLVLAEFALEWVGRDGPDRPHVARLHYWIDLLFEIPLVTGIVVTGAWLLVPLWPPSRLLAVKIVLGLTAIAFNLACAVLVVLRHRRASDGSALRRLDRTIPWTVLGLPFGLAAFYLGLRYFGR